MNRQKCGCPEAAHLPGCNHKKQTDTILENFSPEAIEMAAEEIQTIQ